ncbi:MAG TPA: sigma-70 family RNA polymerase sigma factor [Actinophytocola sp.]|uniref:sigma-70 family RNA polymerase sigma factor n=1 Tax=Actinophytocola sp. TaxID=1872138 RepID=UPI002DDD43E0|nr:sigma-70 family RNA polymerase sigma factor [Actinophytocola sp.]HEV2779286.1 sigma-70 family RNA polymerase sigma factor [Actinophytocola sp.]
MTEALEQVPHGPSDAALIAAVRRGETNAYGVLYERHLSAAKRAAACLSSTAAEREDLVAEAFTRVLQILRSGRGPSEEFRPYLLVTMRHLAINAARRTPATALFADLPDNYLPPAPDDPVVSRLHGNDAASAFACLPERWRLVLWHTEIEGETPADIAPVLGMTPNGVAALAYRAREGLRLAYLRQHLPPVERRECRAATAKLAGWVRQSLSVPQQRKISAHLARCPRCRELADGLERLNGELRSILAPIVLGAPFAAAYLNGSVLGTASSGLAGTMSWLSTVKASVSALAAQAGAAAAIAAVTAVTVVASDSSPVGPEHGGGAVASGGPAAPVQQPQGSAAAPVGDQPQAQGMAAPAASVRSKPIPADKVIAGDKAAKPDKASADRAARPEVRPQPPERRPAVQTPSLPKQAQSANFASSGTRGRHAGAPGAAATSAPAGHSGASGPAGPAGSAQSGRHAKR